MSARVQRLLPRPITTLHVVGLSVLIAVGLALWSIYSISLLPPGLHARPLQVATASSHLLVDAPDSWILDQSASVQDFENLSRRGDLFANMLTSPPVRRMIARDMGVAPERIAGLARITSDVTNALMQPNSEERAAQILVSRERYRLDVQTTPMLPVINISAQAPSLAAAQQLADAAAVALKRYVNEIVARRPIAPQWRVHVERLGGAARGKVISHGTIVQMFVLTFLVAFGGCCALLLLLLRLARPQPSVAAVAAQEAQERSLVSRAGDWPRTTRVLPWMIAGFLVVLWLVPFNKIQLTASLPFDLKFDRILLPFLFATWILAVAAGGRDAPRLRGTWIHAGIGGFVLVACLSVVLDAHYLNQTLEFDLSAKKITLLFSYALLFVVIASSLRRTEVPAFFKLTLVLALLCAAGTIYEYRYHYDVFYQFAGHALPGFFTVGSAESGQVDMFGRRLTFGPSEHPLELVGMLTMALPIAMVGLMHAKEQRGRILYGLGTCIILAATIATYRKSALLAPLSVGLTLAYFRRSQLLRLAPLALPALVLVHVLSPGAFGSIVAQGSRLGIGTVSDRAADYDAVRPDLWTHLAFGRGYGSYDHVSYRILDSEMLNRLVDTGVLGLTFYALMLVSILFGARRLIHARDERYAPLALAVSAATVAFFVLSFLFDVTSFPHTPYILMSLAGLVAVMRAAPAIEDEAAAEDAAAPQEADDDVDAPRPVLDHHPELLRPREPAPL